MFFREMSITNSSNIIPKTGIAPAWVPSPSYRGTFDIFWSCLITLSACVYTAIHLNVPPLDEGNISRFWRKIKWVGVALFAPEIVLYTAIIQFYEAWTFVGKMNKLRGDGKKYDLEFGFFVVMGGCVDKSIRTDRYKCATLTPEGIITLAEERQFVDYIDSQTITGRSKADTIGKALVCIQVTWFVTRCIANMVSGHPLALIEFHTMVHVGCALLMYALWWKKPQDVSDPCTVDTKKVWGDEQTALYVMASNLTECEIKNMYYVFEESESIRNSFDCIKCEQNLNREVDEIEHLEKHFREIPASESEVEIEHYPKALFCDRGLYCKFRETPKDKDFKWSSVDLSRWLKAAKALRTADLPGDIKIDPDKAWLGNCRSLNLWQLEARSFHPVWVTRTYVITTYAPNLDKSMLNVWTCWSSPGRFEIERDGLWQIRHYMKPLYILLPTLSILYGGVHLTTWHSEFPSRVELTLWKIATISIMAGFPSFVLSALLISLILQPSKKMNCSRKENYVRRCEVLLLIFPHAVLFAVIILYGLSRVYLVAESFASLRHVPVGVYAIISWVQLIPHF